MDTQLLVHLLILITGCGAFLRLVGKEKHRREKYLQLRLEETLEELRKHQEANQGDVLAQPMMSETPEARLPAEDD